MNTKRFNKFIYVSEPLLSYQFTPWNDDNFYFNLNYFMILRKIEIKTNCCGELKGQLQTRLQTQILERLCLQ